MGYQLATLTGLAVWAMIGTYLLYLLLYKLLFLGVVNSVSYHLWSLRTSRLKFTAAVLVQILRDITSFYDYEYTGSFQARGYYGGYWRSAFDYSDFSQPNASMA